MYTQSALGNANPVERADGERDNRRDGLSTRNGSASHPCGASGFSHHFSLGRASGRDNTGWTQRMERLRSWLSARIGASATVWMMVALTSGVDIGGLWGAYVAIALLLLLATLGWAALFFWGYRLSAIKAVKGAVLTTPLAIMGGMVFAFGFGIPILALLAEHESLVWMPLALSGTSILMLLFLSARRTLRGNRKA